MFFKKSLHNYVRDNNIKIVEKKLSKDPNVVNSIEEGFSNRIDYSTPVYWVNSLEMIDLLHCHGADIKFTATCLRGKISMEPIHFLSMVNNPDILKFLIENGVSVDSQDSKGVTPLMFSVSNGLLENVKLLMKENADISIKNDRGWTAIDCYEKVSLNIKADAQKCVDYIKAFSNGD